MLVLLLSIHSSIKFRILAINYWYKFYIDIIENRIHSGFLIKAIR